MKDRRNVKELLNEWNETVNEAAEPPIVSFSSIKTSKILAEVNKQAPKSLIDSQGKLEISGVRKTAWRDKIGGYGKTSSGMMFELECVHENGKKYGRSVYFFIYASFTGSEFETSWSVTTVKY